MITSIPNLVPANSTIEVWQIDELTNKRKSLFKQSNTILYTWAFPLLKCMYQGDVTYKIGGVYFEFENVASPGDTITVPTYNRGGLLSYYTTLASPKDYLRVPLSGLPSISIETGYEAYFSAGQGNVGTIFAQTTGDEGELGEPFDNANNSKVYGVALVATPDWDDPTADIIFARSYFATGEQQLKMTGSQIGITWRTPFL